MGLKFSAEVLHISGLTFAVKPQLQFHLLHHYCNKLMVVTLPHIIPAQRSITILQILDLPVLKALASM